MEKLLLEGDNYRFFQYNLEADFEAVIVKNARSIFGDTSIYVDIKKRIGDEILSIPDGYLIDLTFLRQPRLYIIENELVKHDPYKHIGQQILRFAISYKASGRKIKRELLKYVQESKGFDDLLNSVIERDGYRNIDDLLEEIIFDNEVGCIVVIDKSTDELEKVLSQLTIKTDIIEFQTFKNEDGVSIHKFEEFQADIKFEGQVECKIDPIDLDTIVVPAQEEGFNEVFLGKDCWYSIRISASMVDRIKYIAAYQVSPVSAITHVAKVSHIQKYKDSNKYIIYFEKAAEKIKPVKLPKNKPSLAPQSPRYTNYDKLIEADTLNDIF